MKKSNSKYTNSFIQFFSANLITKFIGFFKEILLGWIFGATKILDQFFFLTSIANVFNATWNKALETTIFQEYQKLKISESNLAATIYLTWVVTGFTILTTILYFVFVSILPYVLINFFPERFGESAIPAMKIILVVIIIETLILALKIFKLALNRFFLISIIQVMQSLAIILGLLVYKNEADLNLLAVLFLVGNLLQLAFVFPSARSFILFKHFSIDYLFKGFKLLKSSSLLVLASGISTLNIFVDQSFALNLSEGAVAQIHYGAFFLTFYQVLIVRNLNTIVFPRFQSYAIQGQWEQMTIETRQAFKMITLTTLFVTVIVLTYGNFLLQIILGYGHMDSASVTIIYSCLVAYLPAFWGTAVNAVLIRILHTKEAYAFIFRVSIINFFTNIILNYVFIRFLGIWGIPLSTSITFLVLVAIYFRFLSKKHDLKLFRFEGSWILRFGMFLLGSTGTAFLIKQIQLKLTFPVENLVDFIGLSILTIMMLLMIFVLRLVRFQNNRLSLGQ